MGFGTEILSGLNLYAGASTVETQGNTAALKDKYEGVAAVTYDLGPVSVGAMISALYSGDETVATTYHTYKNSGFGIAFDVNDDFSVSYGEYKTRKAGLRNSASVVQSDEANRVVEVSSFQAAYTMGGATISIADVNASNAGFTAANDQVATIVSLGLA